MIYQILIGLFRITVRLFFSTFTVKGRENIPQNKPLLIVANHPSTFMDPIVMAVAAKRKIHFIAKGEAFRSKFAKWILPKFNMIPIYRKEHDPEKTHMNDGTFHKVYEILEKGGAVIIFPEGISYTDRILKKLKTGAMRMALGAEARHDFKLDVHILPMGLNFSNPHKFRSKLQINIGESIRVADYKNAYEKDAFKAAHILKDAIRAAIEKLTICIESPAIDQLISRVETIYKRNFLDAHNRKELELHEELRITELVHEKVNYFIQNDPEKVEEMRNLLEDHARLLHILKLDGEMIEIIGGERKTFSFDDALYYLSGLPIFLFGAVNNFLPYKLPGIINRKINARHDFTGAILMSSGTFIFLFFYLTQTFLVQYFTQSWIISLTYLLLLPLTGLMAYYYWDNFRNHMQAIRYHRLKKQGNSDVKKLVELEENIVSKIENVMKQFDGMQVV